MSDTEPVPITEPTEQTTSSSITEVPQRKRIIQPRTPKQLEALEKARAAKMAKRLAKETVKAETVAEVKAEEPDKTEEVESEVEPEVESEVETVETEPEKPVSKIKKTKKMSSNIRFIAR